MKFDQVFVIGVGGTGSHLIEPLTKLLGYHKNGTNRITIIDGDSYEEGNGNRQFFNPEFVGVNKAEATCRKLPWLGLTPVPTFVNDVVFKNILDGTLEDKNSSVLVVMSVDNHASRKALIETMDNSGFKNYAVISPGNGYSDGQIITYCVVDGVAVTGHPLKRYADIANPPDHIPGFGCEIEAVSSPQLIIANASAAVGVLWVVNALLEDSDCYEEIHFNCNKFKLVAQGSPINKAKPPTPKLPPKVKIMKSEQKEIAKEEIKIKTIKKSKKKVAK